MENGQGDNITFRKPQRSSSLCDLSSNQSLFDTTTTSLTSLPNTSIIESQTNRELYDKINQLQEQLLIANQEVTNLNSENTTLQQELDKCKQVINNYKKICTAEKPIRTPKPKSVKHKFVPQTPKSCNAPPILQTVNSEQRLEEPESSTSQNKTVPQGFLNDDHLKTKQKHIPKRNKICILSTDNKNKLLYIAENTFEKYGLCHYITPHGTIEFLLKGLKHKLANYTFQDFCIILIGEEDFKETNKYFDSILLIRQILQEISNTNIIVCTPTYKFFTNNYLYNSRVETFNNLLYLDIITHGHAYFLDSNKNLRYDDSMFNRRTGVINHYGMKSIFKDILDMTIDIQFSNTDFSQPDNQMNTVTEPEGNEQFFL